MLGGFRISKGKVFELPFVTWLGGLRYITCGFKGILEFLVGLLKLRSRLFKIFVEMSRLEWTPLKSRVLF